MEFSNFNLIDKWEGLRLEAYQDGGGVWTIGWGHTKTARPGMKITREQAEELFLQDMAVYQTAVNQSVKRPINQNQFDAFCSLCFNIGVSGFKGSTALKRFNEGNNLGAAEAITWWNKDNGKVVQGLVNRRAEEKALFLTPVLGANNPPQLDLRDTLTEDLMKEYTEKLKTIWRN